MVHIVQEFDRLQYTNMEGEGLRDLVTCGDVR